MFELDVEPEWMVQSKLSSGYITFFHVHRELSMPFSKEQLPIQMKGFFSYSSFRKHQFNELYVSKFVIIIITRTTVYKQSKNMFKLG